MSQSSSPKKPTPSISSKRSKSRKHRSSFAGNNVINNGQTQRYPKIDLDLPNSYQSSSYLSNHSPSLRGPLRSNADVASVNYGFPSKSRSQSVLDGKAPIINNAGSVYSDYYDEHDQNNDDMGNYSASIPSVDVQNPDPEVVKVVTRHLVTDATTHPELNYSSSEFDSLQLQGGDITRELYNWQREHEGGEGNVRFQRSRSFVAHPSNTQDGDDSVPISVQDIMVPGGFRRSFLLQKHQTRQALDDVENNPNTSNNNQPTFLTKNFIEFLTLYGHFAGEELEEEDDDEDDENAISDDDTNEPDEESQLLPHNPRIPLKRLKSYQNGGNLVSTSKAVMLLLKSFVGTGILFLPKGFYNGGLLFSTLALLIAAILSYWCFLLLIKSKIKTNVNSFGDIGGYLFGPSMRKLILFSIVLSQIGFASAYIVFTSQNLQAFILAITDGKQLFQIETLIIIQLFIFLPLSMVRNIAKLSGTALIADFFIFLGVIYLYYYSLYTIKKFGVSDVELFNPNGWTLFIGTAIFTYEGIGLLIPIQESMKKPSEFNISLGYVMIGITFVFVSIGALCYCAFGSNVQTVVILNLPQDNRYVNGVQFFYSLAILLSTPLQLFPAIRILENGFFIRSGKYNKKIKWQKNLFRFFLVLITAFISWIGSNDLDKFVALVGSFACIPLIYIFPPLLHYKSCATGFWSKLSDIVIFFLGIGMMIGTTFQTLSSWINKS